MNQSDGTVAGISVARIRGAAPCGSLLYIYCHIVKILYRTFLLISIPHLCRGEVQWSNHTPVLMMQATVRLNRILIVVLMCGAGCEYLIFNTQLWLILITVNCMEMYMCEPCFQNKMNPVFLGCFNPLMSLQEHSAPIWLDQWCY